MDYELAIFAPSHHKKTHETLIQDARRFYVEQAF